MKVTAKGTLVSEEYVAEVTKYTSKLSDFFAAENVPINICCEVCCQILAMYSVRYNYSIENCYEAIRNLINVYSNQNPLRYN